MAAASPRAGSDEEPPCVLAGRRSPRLDRNQQQKKVCVCVRESECVRGQSTVEEGVCEGVSVCGERVCVCERDGAHVSVLTK